MGVRLGEGDKNCSAMLACTYMTAIAFYANVYLPLPAHPNRGRGCVAVKQAKLESDASLKMSNVSSPLILTELCADPKGSTGNIPFVLHGKRQLLQHPLNAAVSSSSAAATTATQPPTYIFSSCFYLEERDRRNKPETVVTLRECCNLV